MSINLFDYQSEGVDAIRREFKSGKKSVCLVAPTGAGKNTIASYMLDQTARRGFPCVFLAHRRVLIDQASKRVKVPHGVIMAGFKYKHELIQIASLQTLVRRAELPKCDLLVVDECHHSASASHVELMRRLQPRWVVGLTATPTRLDGRPLGDIYDAMVELPDTKELTDSGRLCRARLFEPSVIDLSGVRMKHGAYDPRDIDELYKPTITGNIIESWKKIARDRCTVGFAHSVEASKRYVDMFREAGIESMHIDATTPEHTRDLVFELWRGGAVRVVWNVGIVSEGFDLPEISSVILARPTASTALAIQMMGRALRALKGKKDAVVLDHAGLLRQHGWPTDAREWSLSANSRRVTGRSQSKLYHRCPTCLACYEGQVCPECGHVTTSQQNAEINRRAGELFEASDPMRAEIMQYYRSMLEIAKRKGYRRGWSTHRVRAKYGDEGERLFPKRGELPIWVKRRYRIT